MVSRNKYLIRGHLAFGNRAKSLFESLQMDGTEKAKTDSVKPYKTKVQLLCDGESISCYVHERRVFSNPITYVHYYFIITCKQ